MGTKGLNNDYCQKNHEKTVINVNFESAPYFRRVFPPIRRLHELLGYYASLSELLYILKVCFSLSTNQIS